MSDRALTEFDLYLFGEGRHRRIYDKLGAHPAHRGGAQGVQFAVWAPNAAAVSVVGPFDDWDGRRHPLRPAGASGIWEGFVAGVGAGALYKFEIRTRNGDLFLKSDPYGTAMQLRPENCSVVAPLEGYEWGDAQWIEARGRRDARSEPMWIYEVHLGSWKRPWDVRTPPFMSWREAEQQLIPYVLDLGYTHLELMGVAEHPLDESWGYQVTGYYAATARYGSPQDFMHFMDACHRAGIGVILDWVPAHFPRDAHGLSWFDGTALYEHADTRLGEHRDWGTKIFNYGRHEVRNFLVANALFWIDRFHIDGLRVDAVASMLYLDYSRQPGEWLPNRHGGRENLEAIEFLKEVNSAIATEFPGVMTIAEESTAFAGVTRPVQHGGLGFTLKWNMGWMNDTLRYFAHDPVHRRHHHHLLTFSFVYAWSENFVLPISHDEVVHGKASLLSKMPGDEWQRRANLRLLLAYQLAHPGKKLTFMGSEFGQWREWRDHDQLDWHLLAHDPHRGLQDYARDLNRVYRGAPPLFRSDADPHGFQWVEVDNAPESIWAFERRAEGSAPILCVFNGTPVPRNDYALTVSRGGDWRKILDSDAKRYGGSQFNEQERTAAVEEPGRFRLRLHLPPLGAVFYRPG
jgi:1,4-alpha-glucan branching enzyme